MLTPTPMNHRRCDLRCGGTFLNIVITGPVQVPLLPLFRRAWPRGCTRFCRLQDCSLWRRIPPTGQLLRALPKYCCRFCVNLRLQKFAAMVKKRCVICPPTAASSAHENLLSQPRRVATQTTSKVLLHELQAQGLWL